MFQNTRFTKKQKTTIFGMVAVIAVMLFILMTSSGTFNDGSRTIMIYMIGSNLETNSYIATADINSIIPENVDTTKTNILLYTGGTTEWHNFVKNDENAIYKLEPTGFEKVESYSKDNMGASDTLLQFLDYSYKNYKASNYDLIFYDHGGAVLGAMYDDFTYDNLSVGEMDEALSKSPFKKKKLELVIFRTCLNGTIEVANMFSNYAKYLVASEEITYGSYMTPVFGFMNEITTSDNGLTIGQKFISHYQKQMEKLDAADEIIKTYSIIDLSKIPEVTKNFDSFISELDADTNYYAIAKVRSKLFQYGEDDDRESYYDMVDLYSFIDGIKDLSLSKANKLLSSITAAVVYKWGDDTESKGLSVYFPFSAGNIARQKTLKAYRDLDFSEKYYSFITDVSNMMSSSHSMTDGSEPLSGELTIVDNKLTLNLSDEEKETITKARYLVLSKQADGTFIPVYTDYNCTLDDNGIISANIDNNFIKIKSNSNESYINIVNNNGKLTSNISLEKEDLTRIKANIKISKDDSNKPIISYIKSSRNEERAEGYFINTEDYTNFIVELTKYKITDNSGNYNKTWLTTGEVTEKKIGINDNYQLDTYNLDNNYYYIIIASDTYNNEFYSKLLKVK